MRGQALYVRTLNNSLLFKHLIYLIAQANKPMHPTRGSVAFIMFCCGVNWVLFARGVIGGVMPLENRKCVTKEESQTGTTSVGLDLSLLQKEMTPYSSTSRHSHAVIADRA